MPSSNGGGEATAAVGDSPVCNGSGVAIKGGGDVGSGGGNRSATEAAGR
jgi:hypothetical protein